MELRGVLKKLYLKLIIFVFIFLIIVITYVFLLRFYVQKITKQVENIKTLKEMIAKNRADFEKELKLKQLLTFAQQKSGREISAILFDVQQKLNRSPETIKDLFLNTFNKENWKIISFSSEEKKLSFSVLIPQNDINKFLDFLVDEVLLIKISELKIKKENNFYQINFVVNLQ